MSSWQTMLIAHGWGNPLECSLSEERLAKLCSEHIEGLEERIRELESAVRLLLTDAEADGDISVVDTEDLRVLDMLLKESKT